MNLLGAGKCHQSGSCFRIISDTENYLFLSPTVLQSYHFPSFGKDLHEQMHQRLNWGVRNRKQFTWMVSSLASLSPLFPFHFSDWSQDPVQYLLYASWNLHFFVLFCLFLNILTSFISTLIRCEEFPYIVY